MGDVISSVQDKVMKANETNNKKNILFNLSS